MFRLLSTIVLFSTALAAPASAQQARLGSAFVEPAPFANQAGPSVSLSAVGPMTTGSLTPAFGALALGVSPNTPTGAAPLIGADPLVSPDFTASFATDVYGSELGLFAGYSGGASLFTAAPTAGFNVGASVGYAGFYLQAGISDNTQHDQRLTNDPKQGWLAGFGYKKGAVNVRFSYMTAQSFNAGDSDSRTWMIGGIYQLSSRLRLNADAFTSPRVSAVNTPATTNTTAAPQGTGARVGVQLRF